MERPRFIKLNTEDNVGIALDDLAVGDLAADGVVLTTSVAKGHKFTLGPLKAGQLVRRYGQVIGAASQDIPQGAHVHVHNLAMAEQALDYAIGSNVVPVQPANEARTFMGYRRSDGQAGTRNYLGVLTSVNCSGTVAKFIAEEAEKSDWFKALKHVDGVVPITHASGCGMSCTDEGYQTLFRTLQGYACNPNFAAILLVGLGCEVMQVPNLFGIRPEKIAYYKELHAAAWPGVLDRLSKSNIRNFSVFLKEPENLLFSYFEYHGNDYAAAAAAIAADPVTREWWTHTDPCQQPLETRKQGEWWASMEEVFHHD